MKLPSREEFTEYFSRQMLDHAMSEIKLCKFVPLQEPLQRWGKFKNRLRWGIEGARIWLSKKIWQWEDE